MPTSDELRAALAVAELEEDLAAAKEGDADPDELRELKHQLRAARQDYRENYRPVSGAVGDGTAEPEAIQTSSTVKEA